MFSCAVKSTSGGPPWTASQNTRNDFGRLMQAPHVELSCGSNYRLYCPIVEKSKLTECSTNAERLKEGIYCDGSWSWVS